MQKFGRETRAGRNQERFSNKELNEKGVEYKKEVESTKKEMHQWQHKNIIEHKEKTGQRPPLNKNDY